MTRREPFWGPGNPYRLPSLTPAQQENVWKADRLQIKTALWCILAAGLFALAVGYPLGLFALL
jgi:hypothetical protein